MKEWWNNLDAGKRWLVQSVIFMWVAQIIYVISPIDLLPDIPIIGQLDDLFFLVSTILFTGYAVRQLRGASGFSGLVPDALRPKSVAEPAPVAEPVQADPYEAELNGQGDDLGIDGYRPLSLDELKAL